MVKILCEHVAVIHMYIICSIAWSQSRKAIEKLRRLCKFGVKPENLCYMQNLKLLRVPILVLTKYKEK